MVEHTPGGRAVTGSNPVTPTTFKLRLAMYPKRIGSYKFGTITMNYRTNYSIMLKSEVNKKFKYSRGVTTICMSFGGFTSVVKAHRALRKMYLTGKEPF